MKDEFENMTFEEKGDKFMQYVDRFKELETSLKELSQKAVTAETSAKDTAIKAIEHSSKPYVTEKQKDGSGKE